MSTRTMPQTIGAPCSGDHSPWGRIDAVEPLDEGVVFVSTPSHGGAWLSPAAQARIPASLSPMHGRTWWEEDCEIAAVVVAFDIDEGMDRSAAIASLARWQPEWLDALAAPLGIVNSAQAARILDRHREIVGEDTMPDLADWRRGQRSGAVEGFIGGVWHTIGATGEAVG
jgi:hypothetical protein